MVLHLRMMSLQPKPKSRVLIALIVVTVLVVSSSTLPGRSVSEVAEETWLFAIYMSADNDLWEYAAEDLQEILSTPLPSYLTITILIDQNNQGDSRAFTVDSDGYEQRSLNSINSSWDAELQLNDPDVLRDFFLWSVNLSNPSRTLLVIWGHGRG